MQTQLSGLLHHFQLKSVPGTTLHTEMGQHWVPREVSPTYEHYKRSKQTERKRERQIRLLVVPTEEPNQAHHPLAGNTRVSVALYTQVVVPWLLGYTPKPWLFFFPRSSHPKCLTHFNFFHFPKCPLLPPFLNLGYFSALIFLELCSFLSFLLLRREDLIF